MMTRDAISLSLNSHERIFTAYHLHEIQEVLSKVSEGAVIFIDVDDTLIAPQSTLFRAASPYRSFIDQIKKDRDNIPNFERVLSHWRLQRKTILVSEKWPHLIQSLKIKYPVYGLTKMETGALGDIPSMEKWRYEELKDKGVIFTPFHNGISEEILVKDASRPYSALFFQGIFVTGSFNKGEVIHEFLKTQTPTQIILVDDRQEMLDDVDEECTRQSMPFLGIHFKGAELMTGAPNPKIAEFQKQYLLKHCEWLEDEEAEKTYLLST